MSGSDVRDVDSLIDLRRALDHLGQRLSLEGQQLKQIVHHADQHFSHNYPAYWREQLRRAERELTEAENRLSRKQSVVRAVDRVPATEEKKAVQRWKQRARLCQEKLLLTRRVAIDIAQALEKFQGPIADLIEQGEVILPTGATHLQSLIDRLQTYGED